MSIQLTITLHIPNEPECESPYHTPTLFFPGEVCYGLIQLV